MQIDTAVLASFATDEQSQTYWWFISASGILYIHPEIPNEELFGGLASRAKYLQRDGPCEQPERIAATA